MPKRVPKDVDLKALFRKGEGFYNATSILYSQPQELLPHIFTAAVTCQAFATEVYLKVLAGLHDGLRPLATHDLLHLFENIPQADRTFIEQAWDQQCLDHFAKMRDNPNRPKWLTFPQSMRQALELGRSAFIDWRYEGEDRPIQWHLGEFTKLSRQRVLELMPLWLPRRTPIKEFMPGDPTGPPGWD